MKPILSLFILLCLSPSIAFAYLDPGTGSLLLSSAIALFASAIFFFKSIFYKVISLTSGGGVKLKKGKQENHKLVFYSEGKQYHNVFKPILTYLDSISYPYTYLTSSKEDFELYTKDLDSKKDSIQKLESTTACHTEPLGEVSNIETKKDISHLHTQYDKNLDSSNTTQNHNPNAQFEYIGSSDSPKAISRLNSLRADIVMMSTPQLDILQIKRSKGVKHYSHIIHSLPHVDIYEVFALDYFDSVFTNSIIHTDFIHEVERVRNLKTKEVVITGCTYLDILQEKLQDYKGLDDEKKIHFFPKTDTKTTILLAPSWGREALLSKYGMKLIQPFIDSNFNLIIRPHPQSYNSEKELLDSLQAQTKDCSNIVWDNNRDNIYALHRADMMIGDFSGVIFDFVCLFEKPVLTPTFDFNIIGYDLEDIYDTPWVKDALTKIGKSIEPSEFDRLPSVIESLLQDKEGYDKLKENIREMKALLWEYQGVGGIKTAQEILRIEKEILESRLQDKLELHNEINVINRVLENVASGMCGDSHIILQDKEDSIQNLDSKNHTLNPAAHTNTAEGFLDNFKGCADLSARSYLKGSAQARKSNSLESAKKTTQNLDSKKDIAKDNV
ncbi:MAG: CDP-glycerol glycerophosphotransferase family protein [Helicobacter sp.]|uniref:CDP-glycerol glycerophosphotransferase family protein n=1 Tax=Helicobacter sp. TaxID=218 RepID=UPI002A915A4E|nr:CDP-glycerol glycerophosphotransferase family protein [Helicobacter sp.]MDY5950357.1 CDP-glycerol glycerophosphotransferase family protein [Helicobacter sp.]